MPQRSFHFKEVFGNKYSQFSIIYGNGDLASTIQRWFSILIYVINFKPPSPSNFEPELLQQLTLITFPFTLADKLPIKMLKTNKGGLWPDAHMYPYKTLRY